MQKKYLLTLLMRYKSECPGLGDFTAVSLYRLFSLVAMEDIMGTGAFAIRYYAGKKLGMERQFQQLEDFLAL